MADQKKRISELPESSSTTGLYTLGVNAKNESVKVPLGTILSGIVPQAQQAVTTANAAKTAADEAKTKAQTALNTANQAASAASSANTAAGEAKSAAQTAIGTAGEAKSIAQSAKTAADDAASAVEDAADELKDLIAPRLFVNASVLLNLSQPTTLSAVISLLAARDDAALYKQRGTVITFLSDEGWQTYQHIYYQRQGAALPQFDPFTRQDYWRKFGGSATVGNCYNVTVDAPKAQGFYTLEEAIAKTFEKGYTNIGIQITFSIANASWKTYQYIGADSSETNFKNPSNWLDLAGMSAGDEVIINVDHLCGACTSSEYYTLQYAIAAIMALQTSRGINYAKSGLIITYKVSDTAWETKQFKGSVSDFGEAALWSDFGGGGSSVETSDTPEEDGTDAFSTGGAYVSIPTEIDVDTSTEGVVKLALKNAKGQAVGDQKQFAVGTGSGSSTGTIVAIIPEESPLYAKAGGSVILKAAVRSVTMQGQQESTNIIERVELYDRDTNQLLETFKKNQASSADAETYDFEFNLSSYFTLASSRKFRLVAYDDSENSGSRNINVTAVDVTIKSEQTLNYTSSTFVAVGGNAKSLPMYKFPNNTSDKGILCTVEMYIGGQWKTIGTATITDSFQKSITINPKNCAGSVLAHGAYPVRIHGVDVASGVVGNYLYTTVFVIEQGNTTPLVATRWYSDGVTAQVKQYETISIDFAVYSPLTTSVEAKVIETIGSTSKEKASRIAYRSETYTYSQRVGGTAIDGSVTINLSVKAANKTSQSAPFKVQGTLLSIEAVNAQLMVDIDFSGRSNSDADKTISSNGYSLRVDGSNYSTNGFVKDSFGTDEYGTENDKGIMALRFAENITGSLDYTPFNQAAVESNGMAVQFRIRTKHIADDTARLISCINNGYGFYVTGKQVVFTTDNNATVAHSIVAALKDDSITDVAIVIEPASQAPYGGIGVVKMYFDGELIGSCYYERNTLARHASPITFDGTSGDLYLYNIRAWETYYSFEQAFNNYLLELSDTDAMISEYNYNQVMASQAAENKPATNRPQARALYDLGIPYFVLCKNADTATTPDNYPEYLETLNGDKKTSRLFDVYAYFPDRPWQDFKAIAVPTTNQGTTSSMRPIKNIKMKLGKCASLTLLHERSEFSGVDLAKYDECAANAAKKRVQPLETSKPTNIITVKVDYSESGGANNGASTQLFNELQIALGSDYMTPAQVAYFAQGGKYILNTSIDSIPIAFFRTDRYSDDATSPSYGYFHAKGNWNDDKGDAAVFGFEDVDGYNADCLNYGAFIELIAARNQTLAAFAAAVDKSAWDTSKVYVLSEFCGPNHKVYRYRNSAWTETTGTMTFTGGRWRITGDFVNPVENYELRAYNALDWFQGVNSVDDMLVADDKGKPIWLTYFESRYPDDDDLNQAYEDGRKVPYNLYKWLEWCQQCNQNLTEADGNITIDGSSVTGTKANRLKKFTHELHKVANPYSMICYHVFTDYIAAVDQRSKNMMVGFYLEKDGSTRMYLNHLYDGDTILGSDNDCGLTIPAELDPNNDPNGYYQGHDSVLFTQLAAADYIWLTDYASESDKADTTKTTTVAAIAAKMRTLQLASGLRPFSPQGIEKYWITDRLQKWPKLVSSYDGVRKYIEHSSANDNYFFALHGLSIQRLQDFVKTRFLYRDGFYKCGDTFSSAIQMRCTGTNMSVTIKAAKDGFFGIGVDQANSARESVYLKAGESATLHSGNTNLGGGVMLYIFGADRIAELDIRNATPKQQGWDISQLTLLKKLIIGGSGYSPATSTGDELSTLNLGQLPFLEEVDARNFPLISIDGSLCPRLKKVQATGTTLQRISLAETSPIQTLSLPATMTALSFVNLPNLTYPNGGLTIAGTSNITSLRLSGNANIDPLSLITAIINGGANLAEIAADGLDVNADTTILDALMASNTKGIGSDLTSGCDGLHGTWLLTSLIEESKLSTLKTYFRHGNGGLTIHNAQYSVFKFDDTINDPKNITNLENNTTGDSYVASGHILRIRAGLIPVFGKLNPTTNKWVGKRLSDATYRKLADGSDFDYTDSLGENKDAMMRCPLLWYKGINDFKNQCKYIAWSSLTTEPISSARKITRKKLSTIVIQANAAVTTTNVTVNTSTLESDGVIIETPNYSVYEIDVEGMKQVRWPGLNNANIGALFLNENGVAISTYNMAVSNPIFDFAEGEDYVFINVPAGAKKFVFTSRSSCADHEAIAVDSSEIEAIEPDWVKNDMWLGAIYHASIDSLMQLRSVSGANVRVGTGTSATSSEWTYEADGTPKNTPLSGMNYTGKDFQNLARRRGTGYQLFDYEMSKLMAILWMCLNGTRDVQLTCGYGRGAGGSTGSQDAVGNHDTARATASNGNKILGFENFVGCTWEFMDNVAVNVESYEKFYKNRCVEVSTDPIDAKWHIYDPISKTERVVQGITANSNCIARVKHGRFCDVIASKVTTDTSVFAANYCDGQWYSGSRGRVVGRSHHSANANGGLVYAYAGNASSYSSSYDGSRLAFRGAIEIEDE